MTPFKKKGNTNQSLQKLASEIRVAGDSKSSNRRFSLGTIKLQEVENAQKPKTKIINLEGRSCCILGKSNIFRVWCAKVVGNPYFDNSILFLIGFSTVLLALENPLADPESSYTKTLK